VTLQGSAATTVRVVNGGSSTVDVDVSRAGFGLDLRGRPRIVSRGASRSGSSWLSVRPLAFALRPGTGTDITIAARVPQRAEPGDHDALVLLTARARPRTGLVVRMRLGIVVDVRAPGRIVHRLVPLRLDLRRVGRARAFELLVANTGNVAEELVNGRARLTLRRNGLTIAHVQGEPRRLLPRTRGVVLFRYRARVRGTMSAVVQIARAADTPAALRRYRVRL
jgi:hypothetical protein